MPAYIAKFSLKLKTPIVTNASEFSDLQINLCSGYLQKIELKPILEGVSIAKFEIKANYNGDDLHHATIAGLSAEKGVIITGKDGYFLPPFEVSRQLISPMLYSLSAITLQEKIFYDIAEDLFNSVSDFVWELPDGTIAPQLSKISYPSKAFPQIQNGGMRNLTSDDWVAIGKQFNGDISYAPELWKFILADAHRERENDVRNVIIRCATALDVAIQPLLPINEKFDMRLFRGEVGNTPDLRISDQNLYATLARLWFTRHGIVHKGAWDIYEDNPQKGATPIRKIEYNDVIGFLQAVPKGIEFVVRNPP